MRLFHLVQPGTWRDAIAAGTYRPASLSNEGFVHFSFAGQVAGTANLRYRDEPELVVVEIESEDVDAVLKVEDSYGSGTEFPHIYGAIPVTAAVGVHPLERSDAGEWAFSPGGADAAASSDH